MSPQEIAREAAEAIDRRLQATDFDERGPSLNVGHAAALILAAAAKMVRESGAVEKLERIWEDEYNMTRFGAQEIKDVAAKLRAIDAGRQQEGRG